MIKKILIIFTGLVLVITGLVYKSVSDSKTLIIPFPYSFQEKYVQKFQEAESAQIKKAEEAQILIVGDELGLSLNPYLNRILTENQNYLRADGAIFNWSSAKEPLFRTVFKMKQLSKLPPIVIYLGANSELREQKFDIRDLENITHNFNVYDDEKLISLIITFPVLSKLIYKKMHYFELEAPKSYNNLQSSQFRQKEKELNFRLFNYEVQELIDLVKKHKSQLILSSTPINLQTPPHSSCPHTQNEKVIEMQQSIEALLKEGASKDALKEITSLAKINFANAQTFYLLGQAQMMNGDLKEAYYSLQKASIFDCDNWRGNAVYNAILFKKAQDNGVSFIDFDKITSEQLTKEGIFIDETYPHNALYIHFINEINTSLKRIFRTI